MSHIFIVSFFKHNGSNNCDDTSITAFHLEVEYEKESLIHDTLETFCPLMAIL
jgi:hypothetical protein